MADEIERKYLVDNLPELPRNPSRINQGYLSITPDGSEVRVRQKGLKHFLTQKFGIGLHRDEEEREITADEFAKLWPATEGRRIEKNRYEVPIPPYTAEVDVYLGSALMGLQTVEVEFPSVEEAQAFQAPDWFGREVTADKRYKNQQLALHGIPKE